MNFAKTNFRGGPPSEVWESDDICSYQIGADTLLFSETELESVVSRDGETDSLCVQLEDGKRPYFVGQKGGTFVQENPDVEVLYSRGRHLLVALSDKERDSLCCHNHICWKLEPLEKRRKVVELVDRTAPAETATRDEIAPRLDKEKMRSHLEFFAGLRTRFAFEALYDQAAEHAKSAFESLGLSVEFQRFEVTNERFDGEETHNVVARKRGSAESPKVVFIVGHLDSINLRGIDLEAPGADDNASGSTGVLMLAEALAGGSYQHDLVFVLFGGEEIGLHGSKHFVDNLQTGADETLAVLNMDMIGRLNTDKPAVLLEGGDVSRGLIDVFAQQALAHTDLDVEKSFNPFASDHVPFIQADYPALLTIEGGDRSNVDIHTEKDTIDVIDYDFMQQILMMNLSAIERILEQT